MNDTVFILIRQILQMFLLGGLGFAMYKAKKITAESSKAAERFKNIYPLSNHTVPGSFSPFTLST